MSCAGDTCAVAVALATDEEEEDDEEEDEDDDDDDVAFVFVFFAPAGAARYAALHFDDIRNKNTLETLVHQFKKIKFLNRSATEPARTASPPYSLEYCDGH